MALSTLDPEPDGSHDDLPDMSPAERAESDQLSDDGGTDKKWDRGAKWGDRASMYRGKGIGSGGGKPTRRSIIKRRVQYSLASTMLIAALGVGGGAGLWMAGPGQLVMFAEVFKDFSFGGFDDQEDSLQTGLSRRLLFRDVDAGERKLSIAGRKMYRNLEKGLKEKHGITFDTSSSGSGRIAKINLPDGSSIDVGDMTPHQARVELKAVLRNNKISRLSYYTKYRPLMQKRFRIKFTFFEKTRDRVREGTRSRANAAFEKLKEKVGLGNDSSNLDRPPPGDTEEGRDPLDQADTENTQSRADLEADIANGDTPGAAKSKLKGRLLKGLGVVGIATLGCQVQTLSDSADKIARVKRLVPLIGLANSFFSAGGQVQAGEIGQLGEVGELTEVLSSPSLTTTIEHEGKKATVVEPEKSWIDAGLSRAAVGSPWRNSPAMSEENMPSPSKLQSALSSIAGFFDAIPMYGEFCSFVNNRVVGWILKAADFITSWPGALAGQILESTGIAGKIMEKLISFIAGDALNIDAFDPYDFANGVGIGGVGSASTKAHNMGGWKLSSEEANIVRANHINSRRKEFAQRPIFERLLDYSHPDSFITQATFQMPHTKQQVMLAIAEAPKNFLSGIGAIFAPEVFAADDDCRGQASAACLEGIDEITGINEDGIMQEYGFTDEEIAKIEQYDPDYLVDWYLGDKQDGESDPNPYSSIDPEREKYDKCFDGDPSEEDDIPDYCDRFDNDGEFEMMFRGARYFAAASEGLACLAGEAGCPVNTSSGGSSGATASCQQPSGTPEDVINNVVFPIVHSIPGFEHETIEVNEASNARHGPTVSGSTSDHQGPPERAWATDISNGQSPTPQMDELAQKLANCFNIPWGGEGLVSHNIPGYRLQLIYRTNKGGNHYNHVHFGVKAL